MDAGVSEAALNQKAGGASPSVCQHPPLGCALRAASSPASWVRLLWARPPHFLTTPLRAQNLLCSEAEPSCFLSHMEPISEPAAAQQGACSCGPQMVMLLSKRPLEPAVRESKITPEEWDRCHPRIASRA